MVVALQVAALAYGLHTVAQARPAFLVFTVDRYVTVSVGELPATELQKAAKTEWQSPSWTGYHTVFVRQPTDPNANYDLIVSALSGGRDLQHVVENYAPVSEHLADLSSKAQPLQTLRDRHPDQAQAIDVAVTQAARPAHDLAWLPVQAGSVFWTALIDKRTALPVAWLNIDPF